MRGSMQSPVAHHGGVPDMPGAFTNEQLGRVRNVPAIVANAQVDAAQEWSLQRHEPDTVRFAYTHGLNSWLDMLGPWTSLAVSHQYRGSGRPP